MVDRQWLEMCANAGEFLYGIYTVKVLRQMYERKRGCRTSQEELLDAMQSLEEERSVLVEFIPGSLDDTDLDAPGFFAAADVRGTELESILRRADADGNPYASLHFDSDEQMEVVGDPPEDLEFYVPTEAEIMQILEEVHAQAQQAGQIEAAQAEIGEGLAEGVKHVHAEVPAQKPRKEQAQDHGQGEEDQQLPQSLAALPVEGDGQAQAAEHAQGDDEGAPIDGPLPEIQGDLVHDPTSVSAGMAVAK